MLNNIDKLKSKYIKPRRIPFTLYDLIDSNELGKLDDILDGDECEFLKNCERGHEERLEKSFTN